jgi:hypothetical protein
MRGSNCNSCSFDADEVAVVLEEQEGEAAAVVALELIAQDDKEVSQFGHVDSKLAVDVDSVDTFDAVVGSLECSFSFKSQRSSVYVDVIVCVSVSVSVAIFLSFFFLQLFLLDNVAQLRQ